MIVDIQLRSNHFFLVPKAVGGSPCFEVLKDIRDHGSFGGKNGARIVFWTTAFSKLQINHKEKIKITGKCATSTSRGEPP